MKKAITVSQLNLYVKMLIGNDAHLSDVLVRGEISNFKKHYSGHLYFTLKDDKSSLNCIMFSSYGGGLKFIPENGMQVTAAGYVSVYEKSGQYQLYVTGMLEEGEGALYLEFEKLKKKLSDEGLFNIAAKKPVPFLPDTIGVVTSETGSVIRDIQNVLGRRFPAYHMVLYPSAVQGREAARELAAGIEYFNTARPVDVIIIARGGGSIEDLWPFNEEVLARAIYKSRIPVISGVGHETDFTIADFAADMRAPTPSAAAELAVPDASALREKLGSLKKRMRSSLSSILDSRDKKLAMLSGRPVFARPGEIFEMASFTLDRSYEKITAAIRKAVDKRQAEFMKAAAGLELLSPLATLSRGYSVLSDSEGHVITSIGSVAPGDRLSARVADGMIHGVVDETEERNGKEII
ncbi:MAG: exodeoxyribonuclease VII large subunit [Clostridia bacterium]|nr:exodeoxyribonuclease VII large subunit [Clostridia bacterium]